MPEKTDVPTESPARAVAGTAPCDARPPESSPVLAAGRNCWRIERASRVAFLVDGERYFGAVRAALANAQRSIFILGWDIDSRMRLVPDGAKDGWPEPLGDFLNAVVAARRGLRGYVLSWDFAMLYAMEREWLPIYKLDWSTHRRLSFRLDDRHPAGASQHQKLIVVDDAIAFVGGYDLTRARWDTSEHACNDPRRVDHRGASYPPFHDVGIAVGGDCARALGLLARDRWRRATGRLPRRLPRKLQTDPWPGELEPALTDVDVAISRTLPPFDGRRAVGELRHLHLDLIASARRSIFVENQYFTSRLLADAFARRLARDDAPEIALISPFTQSGWLEISTMGVLRARNHRELRAADRHDRYRMYAPTLPWLDHRTGCLNVHSKVMVVDDDVLMIGSANLADRSMGTDSECNLAIEARGEPRVRRAIAGLRERLLAEHLDCAPSDVEAATRREGSLHRAIASLTRGGKRTLQTFDPHLDPALDAVVPDHRVLDPEQPIEPDSVVADLVTTGDGKTRSRSSLALIAAIVVALAAMALAWRFTPLKEWLALDRLIAAAEALRAHPWAPLVVMLAYVVAGLVVFPLLLMVAVTAIVFGPLTGPLYAMLGAILSGAVTFAIGRHLGRETVRKLAGRRLNDLSLRLARQGLIAVIIVRLLPLGPFSIVNVVAGATHIRWRDFLLGTAIGLLPAVVTASIFVDRAAAAIREPSPDTFAMLALVAAIIVALVWALRGKLRARGAKTAIPAPHGS